MGTPGPVFLWGDRDELRTIEPEDAEFLQHLANELHVKHDIISTGPINSPQEQEWIESRGESKETTDS